MKKKFPCDIRTQILAYRLFHSFLRIYMYYNPCNPLNPWEMKKLCGKSLTDFTDRHRFSEHQWCMDQRNQRNLRGENIQCEGTHADLADLAEFSGIYQCIIVLLSVSSVKSVRNKNTLGEKVHTDFTDPHRCNKKNPCHPLNPWEKKPRWEKSHRFHRSPRIYESFHILRTRCNYSAIPVVVRARFIPVLTLERKNSHAENFH